MPNSLHDPKYQVFREMLVQARLDVGVTQVVLAGRLARPQSYVSKYERGERRIDFPEFIEIAGVLGLDVEHFIKNYRKAISA